MWSNWLILARKPTKAGALSWFSNCCIWGSKLYASRKRAKSRGRAVRNASLAKIRSRSPISFNNGWISSIWFCNSLIACCRFCNRVMLRIGAWSQRFSIRLPIGVWVLSKISATVFCVPPDKFSVISRLRRVAASSTTKSKADCLMIERICGRAVRCVSFTYCSKQPAALSA